MLATTLTSPDSSSTCCSRSRCRCTNLRRPGGESTGLGWLLLWERLAGSTLEGCHRDRQLPAQRRRVWRTKSGVYLILTSFTASGSIISVAFLTFTHSQTLRTSEKRTIATATVFIFEVILLKLMRMRSLV